MDPLSALSIAAAVVQFIQFGCSLVSKAHQIHQSGSGTLPELDESEAATTRLIDLTKNIKYSNIKSSPEDGDFEDSSYAAALETIRLNCLDISNELLTRLHKLRLRESTDERKWKSLRQALKTVWSKSEMNSIEGRLIACRKELDSHLIANTWKEVNALQLIHQKDFCLLDEKTQKTIRIILENHNLLTQDLSRQTQVILESNTREHIRTRSALCATVEAGTARSLRKQLLHTLKFPTMGERLNEICDAHQKTFKWIFKDPALSGKSWSNFSDWLQRGGGIYWINGKAGSGKSTLMRGILESPQTLENIRIWSGGEPTKLVNFFFWNSGTILQRSQIGLFRSLLYEALKDQPDHVPHIFPQELEHGCSEFERGGKIPGITWDWSLRKLQQAFTRLTSFATSSLKFCFFIDGLDEYDGDHESLATFFRSLSSTPHVKLCVSSRPWLIFEEAFKEDPGLKLQDLTFDDIVAYVNDELRDHPKMVGLAKESPSHALELVHEIVTRADGVFLWVTLVVRSLLSGLRNGDDISDLRRRLKAFPTDLGPFYAHMMGQIDPFYKQQASQIFQIYDAMMAVQGSDGRINPLELDLAINASPQNDLHRAWAPMGEEEAQRRCQRLDLQLKSRCAGLLEITEQKTPIATSTSYKRGEWRESFTKVVYLHRTVKDFLNAEDVRALLVSDTSKIPDFESNAWILMSYITRLRRSVFPKYHEVEELTDAVWKTGHLALQYATKADQVGDQTYITMLDELDEAITSHWFEHISNWKNTDHLLRSDQTGNWRQHRFEWQCRSDLLTIAVSLGMCSYVETKLRGDMKLATDRDGLPLLDYAITLNSLDREICIEMVEILLNHGANPNQAWNGSRTIWERILYWLHTKNWNTTSPSGRTLHSTLSMWASILKLLIQHGASPYAKCSGSHGVYARMKSGSHDVLGIIADVFDATHPHEANELRYVFQRQIEANGNLAREQSMPVHYVGRNIQKRSFPEREDPEPRKRRISWEPNSEYYNGLSRRHRGHYSEPRRPKHY